ncbi:site-specific integrase [Streptomyces sp. NBC_01571]|uniref:site-specific integrase n=1 Tax=Streptomyces sp. NBC_01571 TaxID=2975883 RepID=UPI00225531A3|nr:site-specific integrase [Streptomyces sp. NBC_01571]MCX4581214.1 site-specific integrase [Streptomyces sp. NBC_01571]
MTGLAEEVVADPVGLVVRLVGNVEKHLPAERVRDIVLTVVRARAGRRSLAQALHDDPSLLRTGQPPAPYCVAKLLMSLHDAGAQDVALPRCGECGRACRYVGSSTGGRWGCSPCFDKPAICAGCHEERRVVSRDRNGEPRCQNCPDTDGDPIRELTELITNLDPALDADAILTALGCATVRPAGQRRLAWAVVARPELLTGAGYEAPTPAALRFIDELVAAGATKVVRPACPRCYGVKALSKLLEGKRICRACFARHAAVPCSGCGAVREPATRDSEGRPLCPNCMIRQPDNLEECVGCRRRMPVANRVCTTTWQLSPRPCQRCVLDQQVRDLLGNATGALRPELAPFREALTSAERPDVAIAWVSRSKARDLLERIGRDERPVTHEVLDELPPGKVLAHLRSVLVATGTLPPRDERLIALEKWIAETVQARTDLAERRILHGYAVWHHMRRLRRRLGEGHATRLQDLNVRCHVTAADSFLTWLNSEGLTLGTCTQPDLERWMADATVSYRDETGHFVRWSVQHRHARGLTYGTLRWTGPQGVIDSEKRWADARRLLNDDTLPTPDRVAGLLLILYAQKIATISQLTVDDVHIDGDTVSITFGTSPVVLPTPLASLVRELVTTRRGKAKIGTPDDVPWLFPGGHPGLPLTDSQIGKRLHRIGIRPKQDRSTALFTLATEVPAAILARMLGVHIKVAVQWQQASAGDWAAYASDVAQRNRDQHNSKAQP